MIAIAFITFRETLEILLVGSVVLASLEQSNIEKKREFLTGSALGLLFSIALFIIFTFAGSKVHFNLSHEVSEILEGINYVGSGIFLFITAILLHNRLRSITSQVPSSLLDTSLFAVGFLLVLREGIEIIVFSLSNTILSSFFFSLLGFTIGISATLLIGIIGKWFAMTQLSHKKLLVVVDWGIKLLALYFVSKGLMVLSEFII